jgi:hypothetical protein
MGIIGGWAFVIALAVSDHPFVFPLALVLGPTTLYATFQAVPEIYRVWTTR